MGEVIQAQLRFFLISVASGLLLRSFYDILLLWRKICKHNFFWIGIEDALYWFGCCIFVFSLFYRENDGIIRGFVLIGIFGGMLLYHMGPSHYIVEGVYRIYQLITKVISTIWKWITKPFRWILKKFTSFIKKTYKNCLQKYKNCFKLKRRRIKGNKKKERKEQIYGKKEQQIQKHSAKRKKSRAKRWKKTIGVGNSVSSNRIRGNTDSFYFGEGKTRRK